MSGAVFALHDDLRSCQGGVDIALVDAEMLEDLRGPERVEEWLERLVVDFYARATQHVEVLVRQQHNRLCDVPNLLLGEQRLIVLDQRDDVTASDVAVIDDRESCTIELKAEIADAPTRYRRADGARVQHAGEDEVVHVLRRPGDFLDGVLAGDVGTDGGHWERMQGWRARCKKVERQRCQISEYRIQSSETSSLNSEF